MKPADSFEYDRFKASCTLRFKEKHGYTLGSQAPFAFKNTNKQAYQRDFESTLQFMAHK